MSAEAPGRLGTCYRLDLLPGLGLPAVAGGVAVDIGGRDGSWLAGVDASTRIVVDLEPVAADGTSAVRGSALDLPLRRGSIDVAYALDVIEHVPDDRRFLGEIAAGLRGGGRLVLSTPHIGMRVFPGLLQPWVDRRWGHFRVRGYDPEHLRQLLLESGFERVEVQLVAMRTYRWFYFPLRLLWSARPRLARTAARTAAAVDRRFPHGARGAVLITAVRGAGG